MSLRIKQSSHYRGERQWDWAVWIDGPKAELDQLASVEYILHPTFPNPHRSISNRRGKFRLEARGWGEFKLFINLHKKDGSVEKREHRLALREESRDKSAPPAPMRGLPYESLDGAVFRGDLDDEEPPKSRGFALGEDLEPDALPAPGLSFSLDDEEPDVKVESRRPTVFLSSGVQDADLAQELTEALQAEDIEVASIESLSLAPEVKTSVDQALERASSAIMIFSEHPSSWVIKDMELAKRHNLPITSVKVGSATKSPVKDLGAVKDFITKNVVAKDANALRGLARQLADSLRTKL